MLSCNEVLARHSEYIDGYMTADERASLSAHLAACAQCARYDRVLRKGVKLLRDSEAVEPDPTFQLYLRYRIAEEQRPAARPAGGTAATGLAVAAVLMLAAGLPLMLFTRQDEAVVSPAAAAWTPTVDATEIAWHGGSAVERPASHVRFAVRTVSLQPHVDVSMIEPGYSPLILEPPTSPPSYSRVSLTTYAPR